MATPLKFRNIIVLSLFSVAIAATPVKAQSTWFANTGNWDNAANWTPAGVPASSATAALIFGGSSSYTATNDIAGTFLLNSLTFNNTSAIDTVTIDSSAVQLLQFEGTTPGLVQSGSSAVAINSGVLLNANLSVVGSGTGAVTLADVTGNGAADRTLIANLPSAALNIGNIAISNDASARTFTLNALTNIAVTGVISNGAATAGNLAITGAGIVTLSGTSTYTGATTVSQRGTLRLDFSVVNAPAGTNVISGTTVLTLGAAGVNAGGNLAVVGANGAGASNTQSLGGLTLLPGQNTISVTSGTGGASATLNLGTITRATNTGRGSVVQFTLPTVGAITTTATSSAGIGGLLVANATYATPYATVGTGDWAARNGTNQIVAGTSVSGFYTTATATTLAGNADVSASTNTTLSAVLAAGAVSSLRFNAAAARTITLATGNNPIPGILVTPNVGANLSTITGGTLSFGSGGGTNSDITIIQNNTAGDLLINSLVPNGVSVTKAGPGRAIFSAFSSGNFNQTIYVVGGTLQLGSGASALNLGTAGSIVNNALLTYGQTGASATISAVISGNGALTLLANTSTLALTGASTYTGATTINAGATLQLGSAGTAGSIAGTSGIANNGTLIYNRTNSLTISTAITGTGALTVNGAAGTLVLTSNSNSFTGGSTIASGSTLQIGSAGTAGVLTGNVANSGTLTFSRTNNSTYAGNITGAGTVNKASGGMLTLTGTGNTYNGPTNITGGTLRIGNGGANGSLTSIAVSIATGTTLAVNSSSNLTLEGNLTAAGTGIFSQAGSGATTLTGSNSLGSVTVTAGTLRVQPNALGASSAVVVSDGATLETFNASASTVTASTLTLGTTTGATLAFNLNGPPSVAGLNVSTTDGLVANGNTNITVYNGATPLTIGIIPLATYSGTVGGAGLTSFNSGTLTLPSRIVGNIDTSVAGQINLNVTAIDSIRWNGNVNGDWDINATANWVLNSDGTTPTTYLQASIPGDAVRFDGTATGTKTINLTTTLSPGSILVDTSGGNYTFSGSGGLGGPGGLTKIGVGTLFLLNSGGNAYTGGTTITAGTIEVGDGTVSGSLTGNVANSGTVAFNPGSGGITFAGAITGSGGVSVLGTNTTIITGAGNTYGGGTTIAAGATLQIGNGTNSGSMPGNVLNNGTLTFNSGAAAFTVAGNISGATGVVTLINNSNVVLTGTGNTYGGGTTIGGTATLQIGDGTLNGSLPGNVTNNATLAFRPGTGGITYAGIISGSGQVRGLANVTTLSGANTYTGITTASGGTIAIASDGAAPAVASPLGAVPGSVMANNITLNSGGVLSATASFTLHANRGITVGVGSGSISVDPTFTLTYGGQIASTTGYTKIGGGTLQLNAAQTYTGTTTVNAGILKAGIAAAVPTGGVLAIGASGTFDLNSFNHSVAQLTGSGAVTLGSATLSVTGTSTFNGVISGAGGLSKNTNNTTLTLGGQSNYTGNTTLNNSATIRLGINNALPTTTTFNFSGTTNTNVVLDLNGFNQTLASLTSATTTGTVFVQNNSGAGTSLLTISNGSGTFGATTGSATIRDNGGTVGGKVALTITGGTTTFNAQSNNTYTGATTINGGTLVVNGSLAAGSAVTVNATGTLAGTGTANGAVTVAANGTLTPGGVGTVGTLQVGSATFQNGGVFRVELGTANPTPASNTSDVLQIAGALDFSTGSIVQIESLASGYQAGGTYSYTIGGATAFNLDGTAVGSDPFTYGSLTVGGTNVGPVTLNPGSFAAVGDSFVLQASGGNLVLVYTAAVPEPQAALFAAALALLLFWAGRRFAHRRAVA